MAHMVICIPVSVVTAVLAFFYGKSVGRGWPSAIITLICTMIGGFLFSGVGQIFSVVLSALIIFLFFALPEHKRIAHEQAMKEREFHHLPNEEDI